MGGVTRGAASPGRKLNVALSNGSWGRPSNVVTSCPETGFGVIFPASFTITPRFGIRATT